MYVPHGPGTAGVVRVRQEAGQWRKAGEVRATTEPAVLVLDPAVSG
ncbi:hypothetical protein [Streptomyces sp. NPDC055186]